MPGGPGGAGRRRAGGSGRGAAEDRSERTWTCVSEERKSQQRPESADAELSAALEAVAGYKGSRLRSTLQVQLRED